MRICSSSRASDQSVVKGLDKFDWVMYDIGSLRNASVLQGYRPYRVLNKGSGEGGFETDETNVASKLRLR